MRSRRSCGPLSGSLRRLSNHPLQRSTAEHREKGLARPCAPETKNLLLRSCFLRCGLLVGLLRCRLLRYSFLCCRLLRRCLFHSRLFRHYLFCRRLLRRRLLGCRLFHCLFCRRLFRLLRCRLLCRRFFGRRFFGCRLLGCRLLRRFRLCHRLSPVADGWESMRIPPTVNSTFQTNVCGNIWH